MFLDRNTLKATMKNGKEVSSNLDEFFSIYRKNRPSIL